MLRGGTVFKGDVKPSSLDGLMEAFYAAMRSALRIFMNGFMEFS